MEKFSLIITAQWELKNPNGEYCGTDSMTLYQTSLEAETAFDYGSKSPFLRVLKSMFPVFDWKIDDGDDVYNTNYCQYVAYPESDNGRYILASLMGDSFTL